MMQKSKLIGNKFLIGVLLLAVAVGIGIYAFVRSLMIPTHKKGVGEADLSYKVTPATENIKRIVGLLKIVHKEDQNGLV